MAHMPADERRRTIIDAAVRVIAEEGAARATTRRVAEAAGAPLASLHYVFTDKNALFLAVVERCLDLVDAKYRESFVPGEDVRGRVRTLLHLNLEWCRSDPGFHIAEYELFLWALRAPMAGGIVGDIYRRWFDRIEALLRTSATPTELATLDFAILARDVVAVLDGMVLQCIALGDAGPGDADVERLVRAATVSVP